MNKSFNEDNSYLLKYKAEIDCGNIIVGNELYMELENLIDDLFHCDEYIYNTDDFLLRADFMEGCLRLTKAPFYNKPIELIIWQKAFLEALYSFKMAKPFKDSKIIIDRFRKALLMIGRKNGKSEFCSCIENSEFVVGMQGADLVCSSNDDAQSSIVYDSINVMRNLYDPKDLDTKKCQSYLLNKITNTKIFKLSTTTRNKEGRNIDKAIVDEVHEMKDNTIVKSIEQSQSTKPSPKLIEITTEGFIVDGYLDDELKIARKIIKKEDDSESSKRFLPWLYTQDSEREVFENPKSWHKSNPSLGIIKTKEYLELQVDLARKSKSDRIFVLSKDFNIKQNANESWLNLEDFTYESKYNIKNLEGCFCIGHVDLAKTTDLCCAKALILKENIKYIATMYFIPEQKLDKAYDDHNAGAKYKEWVDDGYITVSEGNDVDLSLVADWFYSLKKDYDITLYKCGYDQKFAKEWIKKMDEYGWTKESELEMVIQNSQTLSNAIYLCEADFKSRLINYNENPVDRWCLSNACLKLNHMREALVIKTENSKKIDGAVCLVSLYEMYRRYRSDLKKLSGGD